MFHKRDVKRLIASESKNSKIIQDRINIKNYLYGIRKQQNRSMSGKLFLQGLFSFARENIHGLLRISNHAKKRSIRKKG